MSKKKKLSSGFLTDVDLKDRVVFPERMKQDNLWSDNELSND